MILRHIGEGSEAIRTRGRTLYNDRSETDYRRCGILLVWYIGIPDRSDSGKD